MSIQKETLPPNHPRIAVSYNGIGGVYYSLLKYKEALENFNLSQNIREETSPPNLIGVSHYNI